MTPTRLRTAAATALAVAAVVLLGACEQAEDAISDAASDGACRLAQEAVDGIAGQARQAAESIGADPEAAQRELSALRDSVAAAEDNLSGETQARLEQARQALDALVQESRDAAEGAVDQQAVQEAEQQLDDAVEQLTQVC